MPQSIQDLIGSENHCHGCGPNNNKGLRLKSYFEGDETTASFTPEPHQCAGAVTIVNGGVIASLIDCHSVNTAMAWEYKNAGRAIGSEPKIWCVTASLNVTYLKPTPIDKRLELRAKVSKREGRKTWIECTLSAAGVVCAKGEVLAVRIERS